MNNTPFGFDAPEESPGFLLWQVTMSWQRLIKKELELYGISHSQFVIMAILLWFSKKNVELTQVDLIKMSNLDKMTISKSLKKLVSIGLVTRYENLEDTRAKNAKLTKKGEKLASILVPIVEGVDKKFFGKLTLPEQTILIAKMKGLSI
jgi:DNA-binding MarR family transcriptional regulator